MCHCWTFEDILPEVSNLITFFLLEEETDPQG